MLETFDTIADTFKRLRRLQDQDIHNKLHNGSLSPAQERKYKKLKKEIIAEVKLLRLNQARIDALVEQLYDINKRLVGHEGRLMRLAESHGVAREDSPGLFFALAAVQRLELERRRGRWRRVRAGCGAGPAPRATDTAQAASGLISTA